MTEREGYTYLHPKVAERLRGLEISVRRPMDGARQGMHQSPAFGSSVEFAEYREYLPGDPVHRIDWPVYARSDRYVIRQYHEDVSIRCYVLLDISESMDYPREKGGEERKLDYACRLAAALMYVMTGQGDTVSLMLFDSQLCRRFEPASSFAGLRPMLLGLEEIEAGGVSDIEAALHQAAESIRGRAMVVVISDFLEEPEKIIRGIAHLHHDGKEATLFHVLHGTELRLPQGDLLEVTSLERKERLVVDFGEIHDRYEMQLYAYLAELRNGCINLRAPYVLAETGRDIYQVLLERSRQ